MNSIFRQIEDFFDESEKKLVLSMKIDKNYQEAIINQNFYNEINPELCENLVKLNSISIKKSMLYRLSKNWLLNKIIFLFNNLKEKLDAIEEVYLKLGDLFFEEEIYSASSFFYKYFYHLNLNNDKFLTKLAEAILKEYSKERNPEVTKDENTLEKALYYLNKSLKINNKNPKTYELISIALNYLEEYDKSLKNIETGLSIFPDNPDLMNMQAISYANGESYEKAENLYLKIIEKNPDYHIVYKYYGIDLANRKLYEEAINYLRQYINLEKNDPKAYEALGWCYAILDQSELAKDCANKYMDIYLKKSNKAFYYALFINESIKTKRKLFVLVRLLRKYFGIMFRVALFDRRYREKGLSVLNDEFIKRYFEIKDFYQNIDF